MMNFLVKSLAAQYVHDFASPSLFRTSGNDNIVALCPNDASTERLAAIFCAGAVSSSLEAVAWLHVASTASTNGSTAAGVAGGTGYVTRRCGRRWRWLSSTRSCTRGGEITRWHYRNCGRCSSMRGSGGDGGRRLVLYAMDTSTAAVSLSCEVVATAVEAMRAGRWW
eukprot:gene12948-9262_t